jgi:hypothetical protein
MALLDLLAQPRQARSRKAGFSAAGTTCVAIGERPRGSSAGSSLQVAEDGHRHRARDRRRGHHQHVRRLAGLGPQGVALLDAEPVLLVDHDQAEVGELDPS